jgi:protein O-GlcNAc transferase
MGGGRQRTTRPGGGAGLRQPPDLKEYLQAHAAHTRGDLDGAHANYLRALAKVPEHSGCLLGLGLIAFARRAFIEAEELLTRADAAEPGDLTILGNLAAALVENGKFEDCAATCERVLAEDGNHYVALTNLSFAVRRQGDAGRAATLARRAIAVKPAGANAHLALGNALLDAAGHAGGHDGELLTAFRAAYSLDPNNPAAILSLAGVLIERRDLPEAIGLLKRGMASHAGNTQFPQLLARAYIASNDYQTALVVAREFVALSPHCAQAHGMVAQICMYLKKFDDALEAGETALSLDPNLHHVKLDMCQVRQLLCHWDGLDELQRDVTGVMLETEKISGPFHLISMDGPQGSAETQLRAAEIYQKRVAAQTGGRTAALCQGALKTQTGRPLKIGYLSSDYTEHATASLICELIERHDRSRFEVIAYCYSVEDQSAFRDRLRRGFDRFVEIGHLPIEDAADRIRADGVDILVDLKGFTQGSRGRILMHRPAPIQVNYLGFPGTLGAPFVDYIIGDEFVTPMSSQRHYSERIVQLPNCYQPNDTQRPTDRYLVRREDYGLPPEAFVFCSFNNVNKLTRRVFGVWMRLLAAVPGSVLWLLSGNVTVQDNLRREAEAGGVDAERLVFAPIVPLPMHISRMRLADLFLDCFPCTAHTTASEAMWAGLPLVTCAGETFASRVAGSILTAAGLPDLVTTTLEDYEALALDLALDRDRLAAVRARVGHSPATPLFDIARYTRDLEAAYLRMADRYDAGQQAEAFAVRDLPQHGATAPAIPAETTPMQELLTRPDALTCAIAEPETYMDAKVAFDGCPLCKGHDIAPLGDANCTRHQLYKKPLPPMVHWRYCQDCRHVFSDGFHNDAARAILYPRTPAPELAGYDLERQRVNSAKIVQRIAQRAGPGVWLDVGFGNGSLMFTAEEWGYRSIGLDVRPDNVAAMRELGFAAHLATLHMFDPPEPCSVISLVNVLQYIPYPAEAIAACARMLREDGVLFLVLPNMDSMAWRMLDRQKANGFWADLEIYHHFTRQRLYQMLVENGLVPIEYNVSERHRASMEVMAIRIPAEGAGQD